MNRKLNISFYIAALLLLGLFRESVFLNINALLYNKYYAHSDGYPVASGYAFLNAFSYQSLYASKWVLTLLFVAAFWWLQRSLLARLLAEKNAAAWLSMLYLSLLLLAAISFGTGWISGYPEQGYGFSRMFMGLLQSPVPCMMIIPVSYLYKQHKNSI